MRLHVELDAAFAYLYGVGEDDFSYMLSTFPSISDEVIDGTKQAYRDLMAKIK